METPSNKFREELEKRNVSEAEMLERDQKVTYLRFKCQAEILEGDRQHTQAMIDKLKAFGNMIFKLPDSEGRTGVLEENKKLIEANEKQLAAQKLPRAQEVLLSILEEKFLKATQAILADRDPAPADSKEISNTPPSGVGDTAEELKDE